MRRSSLILSLLFWPNLPVSSHRITGYRKNFLSAAFEFSRNMFINDRIVERHMPTGLKPSSSPIAVSFSLSESAADTFTQDRIDLQLNPLDNEVFVVQGINLDPTVPSAIAGTNTQIHASLTSTSQDGVRNLSSPSCLATSVMNIQADAASLVSFSRTAVDTPAAGVGYIGILATNDFFIQIEGTNNGAAKFLSGRMWGYRATASSSIYAALVQSEVLSS